MIAEILPSPCCERMVEGSEEVETFEAQLTAEGTPSNPVARLPAG